MRLSGQSRRLLAFSEYHATVVALADERDVGFVGVKVVQLPRRGSIDAKFC
jgi:hypothetical protein